jgi:leader peptidase (prepilin peptidase)/N-methyltransferase
MSPTTSLAALTLGGLGGLLALFDLRAFRLPDGFTLALLLSGLAFAVALNRELLIDHVAGAALGYAVFALVAGLYLRLRGRDGLGAGDAKLMAGAGAWVGWQGLASVVLVGTLLALAVTLLHARLTGRSVSSTTRVPLGAYLVVGLWTTWLFGPLRY